jgi:hypothetical protein
LTCTDGFVAIELRELAPGGTLVSVRRGYSPTEGCGRDATICRFDAAPVTVREVREFEVEGFVAMEDVG